MTIRNRRLVAVMRQNVAMPTPLTQDDAAAIYAATRAELIALAAGLDDSQAVAAVPMCPDWSIKDVYAHVVGIIDDFLTQNLAGVGTDAWTAAQVDKRRSDTLADVCAEWERLAPQADAVMAADSFTALRATADLAAHRLDVFGTLGHTDDRDGLPTQIALVRYGPDVVQRVADAGLPVLELAAGELRWASGDGDVAASLTCSPFELFRVLTGRRSAAQTVKLPWIGDPQPYLGLLSPYGTAANDVIE